MKAVYLEILRFGKHRRLKLILFIRMNSSVSQFSIYYKFVI